MEAPPFDVEAMLGKEFGDRADWKDVLREADQLARELDDNSVLVRTGCLVVPSAPLFLGSALLRYAACGVGCTAALWGWSLRVLSSCRHLLSRPGSSTAFIFETACINRHLILALSLPFPPSHPRLPITPSFRCAGQIAVSGGEGQADRSQQEA